jgi:hypothetical protein
MSALLVPISGGSDHKADMSEMSDWHEHLHGDATRYH